MVEKDKGSEERIKIFASARTTSNNPSTDIKTPCGRFFFYLHRKDNVNYDGFGPSISPYFPYGINSISSGGGLSDTHFYFTVIMHEKVKNPQKRRHYLITLYLPKLKVPFVGGDSFHYGLDERVFEEFYLETPPKKKETEISIKLFGDQSWQIFKAPHVGNGGLITIPDNLRTIRAIEVSVKEISQEEWEKGPWSFKEKWRESERSLREEIEASDRRTGCRRF